MNQKERKVENTKVITDSYTDEIDLVELALVLLDKLRYIAFFGLLGAIIMSAYAFFRISPTYESVAAMYIVSASDDSVVDLTDLNIGTSLKSDYKELMLSYPVLDQVIEKLDLDMNYLGLANLITIENPTDTRILRIKALTTDPQLSVDIANTLVEVAVDYLPRTMGTEEPNIAQEARVAMGKSGPSYTKYTMMGGLLGALLCCAWILVRYLMDDTIHTAEKMEKYFGITPLAVIPDIEMLDEKRGKKEKSKGRRKK
jgi:capsular polysaccharide biosynthesis protein